MIQFRTNRCRTPDRTGRSGKPQVVKNVKDKWPISYCGTISGLGFCHTFY